MPVRFSSLVVVVVVAMQLRSQRGLLLFLLNERKIPSLVIFRKCRGYVVLSFFKKKKNNKRGLVSFYDFYFVRRFGVSLIFLFFLKN